MFVSPQRCPTSDSTDRAGTGIWYVWYSYIRGKREHKKLCFRLWKIAPYKVVKILRRSRIRAKANIMKALRALWNSMRKRSVVHERTKKERRRSRESRIECIESLLFHRGLCPFLAMRVRTFRVHWTPRDICELVAGGDTYKFAG